MDIRLLIRIFILAVILNFAVVFVCQGQTNNIELSYKEYLDNLRKYHPVAKQANLRIEEGQAELLAAKGFLDPMVNSDLNHKNFEDKLYYREFNAAFKLPTKFGIDVVGGYENAQGDFLNPENSTSDFGLWHLGVEIDAIQGLIVNERKTALDQAKVFQNLMKNEQQIILNELIYEASLAYLFWQQYYFSQIILNENISLANSYYANTKQSFENGEKTAMDTLEAFILYQDAITFLQKNELNVIKSKQQLENYLWFDESPIMLQDNTIPENYKNTFFSEIATFESINLSNHPIVMSAVNKLSYFEIEQKLKKEKLKPKLKLKYNPLLATSQNSIAPNFILSNYKWGFDFSMPLRFRSEKADIQLGAIKLKETALEIQDKSNVLQNKIEGSLLQQFQLKDQFAILSQNVENYKLLMDGENIKFDFGESSVFLLNKRQEKYINGRLKLIELYIELQIELLNYLFYSNQLL